MFNHEDFYNLLEALKELMKLGYTVEGESGVNPSLPGSSGKSLEFTWNGTKLGIRVEGDKNYKYMDLKGADGESPHIDSATNHWFVGSIDTGVNASGTSGADGVTPEIKIGTVTTLPSGAKATATVTGTSANPILNLGIPKGDGGDPASNTDEKVKLYAGGTSKHLNELIDNQTIVVDSANGVIKVITIDGLQATVKTLNFVKNLDRDIMTYLSAIANPMGFKGVVPDDAAISAVTGAMAGDTYIVQNSASNGNKTMTFIYNGTDFVPIAETTVAVRDFTTNPINLQTEVTGILGDTNIANTIARVASVLDKATYEGSASGVVKQADALTGMTSSVTDIEAAVTNSHTHGNLDALGNILDSGSGELALFDDGVYRKVFSVGNTAPTIKGVFWVDTTTPTTPILKYWDGTTWTEISSAGTGTSVSVDSVMSNASENPVQNKVVKKYVDDNIPNISTDGNNAILKDANDAWFVDDKTGEIVDLTDRVDIIRRHQKYVNTKLDYCTLAFETSLPYINSGESRSVVCQLNKPIPFDKCQESYGMEYSLTDHTVTLKAGKTYRLYGMTKASTTTEDSHIIRFYNVTDDEYFNNAARTVTGDDNVNIEEIVTPTKDIEVSLNVAWVIKGNSVTMRAGCYNNTSVGLGINTKYTIMNEIQFTVMEINRAITIDPVDYVNTEEGIEDTPIGTIIPLMSKTAPAHYLICDGNVYNIADYPHLAQHIKDEFGSFNYWGGNGSTTFAVPDLRGEFLRGTGSSGRLRQGSGSAVGVHQDATNHLLIGMDGNSNLELCMTSTPTQNTDSVHTVKKRAWDYPNDKTGGGQVNVYYTSRPTNTSILWCIKAEPTYFMKVEGKDVYSAEEQLVGYWYDNKPLYQKTVKIAEFPSANETLTYPHNIADVDFIMIHSATLFNPKSGNSMVLPFTTANNDGSIKDFASLYVNKTGLVTSVSMDRTNCCGWIVLRYTRTTDLPRM